MLGWKITQFKLSHIQDRAKTLLEQWQRFRASRSCSHVLTIQESKDMLEDMAAVLSTGLYFSPTDQDLIDKCNQFEIELTKCKEQIFQDLLSGLQSSNTK